MEDLKAIPTEAGVGFAAGRDQYVPPDTLKDGGTPFAIVPQGLAVTDLERMLPTPVRIKRETDFYDVDSFCAYVEDFGYGGTKIFAVVADTTIVAILDYHTLEHPSWCDHKARLSCEMSEEWSKWVASDNRPLGQVQFAEFIEDLELTFVEPKGGNMLTLAQNLEVNKSVVFKSAKRLTDGSVEFQYVESVEDNTKGTIKIPEKLILGVAPFKFSEVYKLTARLRYRLTDGKVLFVYLLDHPDKIVEAAFKDVVKAVADKCDVKPYLTA